MTGIRRVKIKPFPCATKGCETKVTNENMQVCDECFQKLYERWGRILFDF